MTVDKAALLMKRPIPERDVEIPGVGSVHVRGLTRAEVMGLNEYRAGDPDIFNAKFLAAGMADPQLTEDEVRDWMAACPFGEVEAITAAILELSGLAEGADKRAMLAFRDGA